MLAQQQRELEALRRRLEMRLREAELARERDMLQLERKIKVSGVHASQASSEGGRPWCKVLSTWAN